MQCELFDEADALAAIPGLRYQAEFLSREEEAALLEVISTLPLHAAKYKEYLARRQVLSFGGSYDFDTNRLQPGQALDERLLPLRERVAAWIGVAPHDLVHALVAGYAPGTPLGWHRDVPDFEVIAGVSLGNEALLRFRPYPPEAQNRRKVLQLEVAPRSIYRMEGEARWGWQHGVPPVKAQRWSITFRTPRSRPAVAGARRPA
ncbi:alpha-ketoglutarate-dependent dioxygenase AlkB [Variovorax sp. OV329]|uniref:alpha-ketoglutarate-dependent dioxygenase AlkB n=1 Tax=Variovorax sp. OV329 TaxID=1882825 RepID=UPI0008E03431|nr:alpha-ketoglutarate-dependent dioxygenase AlkB [Variovorax sp. OV329]SFN01371.1 Alkylated DNA repair dioxygenase AlkB [Variovorax sp. OV329]